MSNKKSIKAAASAFVTAFAKAILVTLQVATIKYFFPLDVGNGPK